jgi:hypothetical protein
VGMPLSERVQASLSESETNGHNGTRWLTVEKTAKSLGVRGVGSSNLPVPTIYFRHKTLSSPFDRPLLSAPSCTKADTSPAPFVPSFDTMGAFRRRMGSANLYVGSRFRQARCLVNPPGAAAGITHQEIGYEQRDHGCKRHFCQQD